MLVALCLNYVFVFLLSSCITATFGE